MPQESEQKPKKIEDLNRLYNEAEQVDQEHFSEQRSNVLLICGEHYTKRNSKYWNRIRDAKDLSQEQKLRLTKNHIQKITKTYVNNIISHAPSVLIAPNNDKEMQDLKAAQLNNSVWQFLRQKNKLRLKTQQWCKDFIDLGEVALKVFWNPAKGDFLGYRQAVDETGNPLTDEQGQMVPSKTPVFSGAIEFERIWCFNLLRDPNAKSMEDSGYLIYRKMIDIESLRAMVGEDEDKKKMITESVDETFIVFDGNQTNYQKTDKQCLLREYFFKPCHDYPTGYFYITTQNGILFEGELPFGIFPIIYEGFDEIQTSPRHKSIVKQLRPYQAEINRSASKMAEHQVTLGDDKLLVQSGTKVTNGGHLPGVRTFQYSGIAPTVLEGRAGTQYLDYMNSQIAEMYAVANIKEDTEASDMKLDPFGALFASIKNKKKFVLYGSKFESFLCSVCETALELAKHYFTDDMLIPAIGKNEYINIAEFRSTEKLCYKIKTEPATDDMETLMGRQLVINHALQYVGNQLGKEEIGKLMRAMPLGDFEESFSDFTLNYDTANNLILALDRGEGPHPNKYDDEKYMISRLVARQRQADFPQLSQDIQQNYANMVSLYEQIAEQKQEEIKQAQSQFIPSGGAKVKVDYYVPDPKQPDRSVRATLPAESIDWLIKQLSTQGSSQEALQGMNQGAVSEIAQLFNQKMAQQGPQGRMPMPPPTPGTGY
jgi:hypothetical protein